MFVSQSALDCSKASRSVGLRSRSEPETVDRVLLNADQVKVSKIYTNIALLLKGSFTQTSCWKHLPTRCLTSVCVQDAATQPGGERQTQHSRLSRRGVGGGMDRGADRERGEQRQSPWPHTSCPTRKPANQQAAQPWQPHHAGIQPLLAR